MAYGAKKSSAGIILCRKQTPVSALEVLLIRKRYTYAYNDFLHGRYSSQNSSSYISLLKEMTPDEILDIWSLDFTHMWYRVWLLAVHHELYECKKAKFISTFLRDGGVYLRNILRQVQCHGTLQWELPKGHPLGNELPINCAIREMTEETRITKPEYRLLPSISRRVNFINSGVYYHFEFFVAIAKTNLTHRMLPRNVFLSGEVNEVAWMTLEQLRLTDSKHHLESIVRPIFHYLKKWQRGKCPGNY